MKKSQKNTEDNMIYYIVVYDEEAKKDEVWAFSDIEEYAWEIMFALVEKGHKAKVIATSEDEWEHR